VIRRSELYRRARGHAVFRAAMPALPSRRGRRYRSGTGRFILC